MQSPFLSSRYCTYYNNPTLCFFFVAPWYLLSLGGIEGRRDQLPEFTRRRKYLWTLPWLISIRNILALFPNPFFPTRVYFRICIFIYLLSCCREEHWSNTYITQHRTKENIIPINLLSCVVYFLPLQTQTLPPVLGYSIQLHAIPGTIKSRKNAFFRDCLRWKKMSLLVSTNWMKTLSMLQQGTKIRTGIQWTRWMHVTQLLSTP